MGRFLNTTHMLQGFQASSAPPAAAWPSLLGAEMIQGGGCTNPADYILPAGVTVNVVPGKMVATAVAEFSSVQNVAIPWTVMVEGGTYRCDTIGDTVTLGSFQLCAGTTLGAVRTAPGTYSEDLIAVDLASIELGWWLNFASASNTMQLDNFSVKSVGLLGVEADWTFVGVGVSWAGTTFPDGVQFGGPAAGVTASLTGTAKTAFDAAVSSSTACSVAVTSDGNGLLGTVQVAMKGGTAVDFTFDASPFQTVTHNVTSGAGSGFQLISGNDEPDGRLVRVAIVLV